MSEFYSVVTTGRHLLAITMFKFILLWILLAGALWTLVCLAWYASAEGVRKRGAEGVRRKALGVPSSFPVASLTQHYTALFLLQQWNRLGFTRWFLFAGALLGLLRHDHQLVPWDDDIDVCIMEEDMPLLQEAVSAFPDLLLWEDLRLPGLWRFTTRALEPVSRHSLSPEDAVMDVFVVSSSTRQYQSAHFRRQFPTVFAPEDVYPLREDVLVLRDPVENREPLLRVPVLIPARPWKLLQQELGERCRTQWYAKVPHDLRRFFDWKAPWVSWMVAKPQTVAAE